MASPCPKKLIPDELGNCPFYNLVWAYEAVTEEKPRNFPARLDEMTERELQIANIVCDAVGTLHFVAQCLEKVVKVKKCDRFPDGHAPCGGCLSCLLWAKLQEVTQSEKKRR